MALPPCSICGEEAPLLVQGDATTGDQTFVGGNCLAGFMLTAAAELTRDASPEWCASYAGQFDLIAANDHRPAKPPATPAKRTRARKPVAGDPDGPPAEDSRVPVHLAPPCAECGSANGWGDDVKLVCDGCGAVIQTIDDSGE